MDSAYPICGAGFLQGIYLPPYHIRRGTLSSAKTHCEYPRPSAGKGSFDQSYIIGLNKAILNTVYTYDCIIIIVENAEKRI